MQLITITIYYLIDNLMHSIIKKLQLHTYIDLNYTLSHSLIFILF